MSPRRQVCAAVLLAVAAIAESAYGAGEGRGAAGGSPSLTESPDADSDAQSATREADRSNERPTHLFLRAAVGPGLFTANSGSSTDRRHFSGTTLSLQAMVGSTLVRAVAIGGAYFRDQVFNLSAKDDVINGNEPDLSRVTMWLDAFGFFIDGYPVSTVDVHLQGFMGFSILHTSRKDNANVDDPTGILVSVGGGYTWPLGEHGSFGVMARLSYAGLQVSETFNTSTTVRVLIPSVLATITMR